MKADTTVNKGELPANLHAWHIFEVMKKDRSRRSNVWVALLIDVDPENLQNSAFRPQVNECWLDLGTHKSRDEAWDFAEQMIQRRH